MADILLFGATGYTGRLTARALAKRGANFVIAGRDRDKLNRLAAETGDPEVRVANVGDLAGLVTALSDVKVMITCVGPFAELGRTAVEAALQAGVHYIDSTGEAPFIEELIATRHSAATKAGIAMAPALGFDEVPADCAATLATEGMSDAELVLTYAFPSTGSRGTLRSALGIASSSGNWIHNGRKRAITAGEEERWSPMPPPLGPKPAVSFPLGEGHLAPLHLELRSLQTYITTDPVRKQVMKAGIPLLRLASSLSIGRSITQRIIAGLPEGPDERQRHESLWTILAEARSGSVWRNVVLTGRDVYGLTAEFLATGAVTMTRDDFDLAGVVSPVQAVGIERWRKELDQQGVSVDIYEPT